MGFTSPRFGRSRVARTTLAFDAMLKWQVAGCLGAGPDLMLEGPRFALFVALVALLALVSFTENVNVEWRVNWYVGAPSHMIATAASLAIPMVVFLAGAFWTPNKAGPTLAQFVGLIVMLVGVGTWWLVAWAVSGRAAGAPELFSALSLVHRRLPSGLFGTIAALTIGVVGWQAYRAGVFPRSVAVLGSVVVAISFFL